MQNLKVKKIFFIPFAGGSKYSYAAFTSKKSYNFSIVPIDLPGRGSRINEDLIPDIYHLADDVINGITKQANDEPYAMFGHSMGAILTFLAAKKLINESHNPPSYLFFSGCTAPSLYTKNEVHSLSSELFFDFIKKLDDTQDEMFENQEIRNFIEPILRSDFQALSNFKYQPNGIFDIPISVLIGTEEKISLSEANAWKEETRDDFNLHVLPGQHFFIYQNVDTILGIIKDTLQKRSLI